MRSAAEVTTALTQTLPDREIKATVVRSTLEALVAKGQAHRTKQKRARLLLGHHPGRGRWYD
ncbi:hypothetical protein SSPO_000130 [Streptomyces antimycoticus]|uniref:Uncharacterized protein n=1 Tax=Streptomyces antimycoticus TaxID=68175 RepID=A0A499U9V9_9ACTN|nr:hypothetical protein SSPO_000130 [Streptomyces antimycoticus]